jgi:hypothetical protein
VLVVGIALTTAAYATGNMVAVWADTMNNTPTIALEKDAAAGASWHEIVPLRFRRVGWIYDLSGNSSQTKIVAESGRVYALGSVCKPHDCNDNQVAFLIEPGGGNAVGVILLLKDNKPVMVSYFGNQTPLEHEWLRELLIVGRNITIQ